MTRTTSPYFSMDTEKLEEVARLVRVTHPKITGEQTEGYLLADWPEGEQHQNWLDTATVEDIAKWVMA